MGKITCAGFDVRYTAKMVGGSLLVIVSVPLFVLYLLVTEYRDSLRRRAQEHSHKTKTTS